MIKDIAESPDIAGIFVEQNGKVAFEGDSKAFYIVGGNFELLEGDELLPDIKIQLFLYLPLMPISTGMKQHTMPKPMSTTSFPMKS